MRQTGPTPSTVDANIRQPPVWLAQFGNEPQGDDDAGSHRFGGMVGLHIDDIALITGQPEEVEARHLGLEFPILGERHTISLDVGVPRLKTRGVVFLPPFGPFTAHLAL
jgi:hypothetical protein